ncbi:MAG: response regulator transcription factor [Bacteroidales bacterium]|nr:response regulator transcription factor [Bacteroidales bacterium]MCF8455509.1 response regulator transcription factor [Bacteroidales bacterium]
MINEKKISVSIVEDTDDIRNALRVLINGSEGFECIHVYEDAETALEDMPDKDIDVVLMDIHLPGMDGIECMDRIKPLMPNAQFMMCTVYDDDDHIFNALRSGASGYILKRTSPAQILEAVRDLNEGGSPMSSEIARRVVDSMQRKNKPSETVEVLTDREKEILDFLSKGFLYKEIALELFISKETVKRHIHNIYEKLHVQNRTEALNKVYQQ